MARIARVVASGYPHHVTQRGNRRQQTFFSDDDYREYLRLMSASCARSGTEVWAYCLMPNHVHLIMVPQHADGLRSAVSEAHRRFTLRINVREGWQGHLWQERFHSFLLDETHLLAAVRYVENNPVRAGLCAHAEDWPWSSLQERLREPRLICDGPERLPDLDRWLDEVNRPMTPEEISEARWRR